MAAGKVPCTVVTGFLGSGKTTLINHILTGEHGKKIAVIEVGVDDALVLDTKEEIFEMNNGCICCTVRGDLIRILTKLLKRKNRFDHILIETTGLADPAPVAQTFFVDDDLKHSLRLDSILTVVDAKHILLHLDEEKPDDVAFADRVLLNKIDLVTEEEKREVVRRIKAINRTTKVIECQQARVELDRILGLQSFDLEQILAMDPAFLKDHHHHEHEHEHEHGHGHEHEHKDDDCAQCAAGDPDHSHHHGHSHKHDSRVSSVGIECEGALDMQRLNEWLSTLLQEKGADIYRSKGILNIAGSDDKYVFHGVHMMLQFGSSAEGLGKPWQPGQPRFNRVVFIGKDLNRQELNDGFRSCMADANGSGSNGAA
ncbi:hypothetical protein CHLNCDRAFT_49195 [Chlorella variabilis]|uniref:CobW C-terminal domain-containing protein n=1 Tax=Chlorella variabilis TaxID=554065 RepID=E1ZR55_CHLVA|nr:hypothetical protein CHLNCDRAFT_49195 [Chlorella variabilis]EFN51669.1 hypothetical protein CHLNCDRAFT_49195 [Chlorella variabilis]|eukprot:XP_005843771.1 hypothetical protein CHLNCDRAFT_49195 [Chlorella variabilis]